jgi:alkylation response protein AidB-like acyl-CoA dehydrogenase
VHDVIALAHRHGRADDAVLRQKVARLYEASETGAWNALRARAEAARGAGPAAANIGKLIHARVVKLAAEIALDILGPSGALVDDDDVEHGHFTEAFVFSPSSSIYGGTNEIQKNIIGEKVLGLPRDPRPDHSRP